MIRRRDYCGRPRSNWAAEEAGSVRHLSVALGVVVVVTVNSLVAGVRDVAIRTIWTEEIDPDMIRVYTGETPYEFCHDRPIQTREGERACTKFLTESVFDEIRGWSGVEAADLPVVG